MKHRTFVFLALGILATGLAAQSTTGTWTLYPPQATTTQLSIDQPINADGSSVWSVKATIPVQYDVLTGAGPVVFSSYATGGTYSYLDFAFANPVTIDQISTLSAVYQFQTGNCHGGALRWAINLHNGASVYAYYGDLASDFQVSCTDALNNQSGLNLMAANFLLQPRYEHQGGGDAPPYVPWAQILAETSGSLVDSVTLVLDAGWVETKC
jgi:hypothetical protein